MPSVEHFENNKYCIQIHGQANTCIFLTHEQGIQIAKELDKLLWELDRLESAKAKN